MGIIDFLQEYNFKKRLERFSRIMLRGTSPEGLSVIEPSAYRDRFLRKIDDIIDVDNTITGSQSDNF